MPIIQAQELRKEYKTTGEHLVILDNLSLEINNPGIYLIKGKSGSGKSTLLNIIGGLDRATSGSVLVQGTDPSRLNDEKLSIFRNRTIGFIFQFHFLLKDFSALENVCIPGYICGTDRNLVQSRACELLEAVGLKERLRHLPGELSGGERQRVAIARALINNPVCLLADEPTGNLDEHTTTEVLDLLFRLCQEFDKTLLMVTHEVSVPTDGQVFYLENGRIR